uniref:Ankyrin repeat domain n=1 Tax=Clandestinovirus TaxID=2831644 RepID=A0A8F8PJW4_9VIRU|nr:ankyrin repeat domain [Clandestinovirus]
MLPIPDDCFKLVVTKVDINAASQNRSSSYINNIPRGIFYLSKRLLPMVVSIHHPRGFQYWTEQLKNCTVNKVLSSGLVEYYAYHGFDVNYYNVGNKVRDLYSSNEEYTAMLHRITLSPFNQPPPSYLVTELFRQGMAKTLDLLFSKGIAAKENIENESIRLAIANGHLDCLKVFFLHKCTLKYSYMDFEDCAITSDKPAILQYLLETKKDISRVMPLLCSRSVFREGCLEVARKNGCKFTPEDFRRAATNGNIGMVKYMLDENNIKETDNHLPYDSVILARSVANSGHVDVLKLLMERGCPPRDEILDCAVRSHNTLNKEELIRVALDSGCGIEQRTLEYAAENITVDQFKMLVRSPKWEDRFTRISELCANAAKREDPDMLKYLDSIGVSWDENTCSEAAAHGRLECLTYAHENGCPWDSTVCERAMEAESLPCLKYALENGCSANRWELMQRAADMKSKKIFKYLSQSARDLYKDAVGDGSDSDDNDNSDYY